VIEIRHEFQEAMREESMAKIAELTGRQVVAMLSANHVNPDLGAEIFVLDGPPGHQRLASTEGTDGAHLTVSDAHQDTTAAAPQV
jgi:hypothetical protein